MLPQSQRWGFHEQVVVLALFSYFRTTYDTLPPWVLSRPNFADLGVHRSETPVAAAVDQNTGGLNR